MIWEFTSLESLNSLKKWCRFFEVLIHWQHQFFDCGAISTMEVLNYPLAEIPQFHQIFLKFCHINSVEIGFIFFYSSCNILRIYFGSSEITTCLINNQTYYITNKSILSMEKLHDSVNYLQQNAEARTRVVGG